MFASARLMIMAGAIVAGLLALGALYWKGRTDGRDLEQARTERQGRETERRGADARDRVDDCYDAGGRWLQSDGRCELPRVPRP